MAGVSDDTSNASSNKYDIHRIRTKDAALTASDVPLSWLTMEALRGCPAALDGLRDHARFPTTHSEQGEEEVTFEMVTDDLEATRK